jgi:succinylglutamic semialdehyde dehydrogenase
MELISTDPATGAVVWQGSVGNVDQEIQIARASWAGWAAKPLTVRIETLNRFTNVVRAKFDAFTDLISREVGKPRWEARDEIETIMARVGIASTAYTERTAQRRLDGALGVRTAVRHKPLGVVAVITPFSSPAAIPAGHIIPALIAGNAVVFKPSEKAIAVAALLVQCLIEAGVPEGVLRLVPGGPSEAIALSGHPRVDGILFTGSSATGLKLHRNMGDTPQKMLALEMSGNNPIIVWDTADIHSAAALVVQSAYLSAGQRCTAARRLIVKEGAHEPLVAEIGSLVDRLIIGNPGDTPPPFMGPLIDNAAAATLQDAFLDLIMKGGRPIKHMKRVDSEKPFVTPGLIDVTMIQNRPDTEHFGPLLQLIRVEDFEAALVEANRTRFGLSAALIGGSPKLYDQFWAGVRTGVVNWNKPTNTVPPASPLGGLGLSGNYRAGSTYTADHVAYPVVSSEIEQVRASVGIGLR